MTAIIFSIPIYMQNVIILPTQLFEINKLIDKNSSVLIYEHPIYFTAYKYHKLKLIFHRSTMKCYMDHIVKTYGCKVEYLDYNSDLRGVFGKMKNQRVDIYDPVDHDVTSSLKKICKMNDIELFMHATLSFLCTIQDLTGYLDDDGKYNQTSFYIWQRKRLNILVTNDGKPLGGKWSFDKENRLCFPKGFSQDAKFNYLDNSYTSEAREYIEDNFGSNPGETKLYLPINHTGAKKHFDEFLKNRFQCFGPYQDAVDKKIIFGCHSVLSPLMNVGLITPHYVVGQILKFYQRNKKKINLSTVEGLIRQIIGWREYMRFVYLFKHKELVQGNHFNHTRKIGQEWYDGTTGIDPIDDIIKKVLIYGYAHHIERLMYLGNFMLLSKFSPTDVYSWFMSMFLDSYNVYMETNVYGMSQYSAGKLLSTRPYFSSSNYIHKMSSYKKGDKYNKIKFDSGNELEWFEIWDALYYNFVNDNKGEFSKNYAIANSVYQWNNKTKSDRTKLLSIAKKYLEMAYT